MWASDFVFDTGADGRSLKCLTIVDEFTRECLAIEWFRNRMEATIGIERWRRHYNEERPHMSLGDLTPAEFKAQRETTHRGSGESPTGVILQ